MIIITGCVRLRPENCDEGARICHEHSVRSRKEEGCISHDCSVDIEDGNLVRFIERWADMAALQQHFAVPESGAFVQQVAAMASAPPEIAIYSAEAVEGAPF